MQITPAAPSDLPAVHQVYADARAMQQALGNASWPAFRDEAILAEIGAGALYLVRDDEVLAGVFSVVYQDPLIWGEQERDAHVYLHRIARAASVNRRGLVDAVLAWAHAHCRSLGREGLRIDTWADNQPLVELYMRHGFRLVGRRRIPTDAPLSPHYLGTELALLEAPCLPAPGTANRRLPR